MWHKQRILWRHRSWRVEKNMVTDLLKKVSKQKHLIKEPLYYFVHNNLCEMPPSLPLKVMQICRRGREKKSCLTSFIPDLEIWLDTFLLNEPFRLQVLTFTSPCVALICNLFYLWPPLKWETNPCTAKKNKKTTRPESAAAFWDRWQDISSLALRCHFTSRLPKKESEIPGTGIFLHREFRRPAFSNCMRPHGKTICSVQWNCTIWTQHRCRSVQPVTL